jgi:hypothetical protein
MHDALHELLFSVHTSRLLTPRIPWLRSYVRRALRLLRRGVTLCDAADAEARAESAAAASRAVAAACPATSAPTAAWCHLRRVAAVGAGAADAAVADAAAEVLRAAGWHVERRVVAPSDAAHTQRFAGSKRAAAALADCATDATSSERAPPAAPPQRAARRERLRAAAGAPPDAMFCSLLPPGEDDAGAAAVRAGVLLSPDAAPHGVLSLLLRCGGAGDDASAGRAVAEGALRAADALACCSGAAAPLALDLAPAGGAWRCCFLVAGPWDAAGAAAAAARCNTGEWT